MTPYPLKLKLRLDWSEMDLFGHINNVSYFKFIQAGRVNYWEHIGMSKLFEENKIGPILASTGCDFKKPLHYPGEIVVETGIELIKETSFEIRHRILNARQEVAAEAKDIVVVYDFNVNKKVPFPPEIRKVVERLEGWIS